MNTFIKVSSNEGGQFTKENNLVSFDIPANQHFNLSTAYLNLVCSVPITAEYEKSSVDAGATPFATVANTASTAHGNGVYMPKFSSKKDDGTTAVVSQVPSEALIRHIKMTSQTQGVIEQIKRNDILRSNLKYYSQSRDDVIGDSYEDLFVGIDGGHLPSSQFCDLNREGTVSSRNLLRQPVRIPLKNMLNFCKVQQYDTGRYGKTRVELELDLERIAVSQEMGSSQTGVFPNGEDPDGTAMGSQNLFKMINLTATVGDDMSELQMSNDGTTGVRVLNRLEDSPFHVGQKVLVSGKFTKGNGADRIGDGKVFMVTRRIKEIKFNRGENDVGVSGTPGSQTTVGSLTLVLDGDPLMSGGSLTGTETITELVVRGADADFGNLVIDFAECVLEQLAPANIQQDNGQPIQYSTFETEEFTTSATLAFQRMMECPPNCTNLYVMRPEDGSGNGQLVSLQGKISDYRIRVDNRDVSDRPINLRESGATTKGTCADPLHHQKLAIALQNSGLQLKSLNERRQNLVANEGLSSKNFDTDTLLIGQVLPITQSPKNVQININSDSQGIQRLILFKEVLKQI